MNTYADIIYAYGGYKTCAWKSVVCETRFDLNDILWRKKPVKKETETTFFTTEATQQKEHTTHNFYIFIRCHFGPLLFALVFAPYI